MQITRYLANEEHFDKLRAIGVTISKDELSNDLDFTNLPPKYGNEQEEHQSLKKLGKRLLSEIGGFDAIFENNNMDVYSRTLGIEIECGNTEIQKVCNLLFNDPYSASIKEVWCIYTIRSNKIELYKFVKSLQEIETLAKNRFSIDENQNFLIIYNHRRFYFTTMTYKF